MVFEWNGGIVYHGMIQEELLKAYVDIGFKAQLENNTLVNMVNIINSNWFNHLGAGCLTEEAQWVIYKHQRYTKW